MYAGIRLCILLHTELRTQAAELKNHPLQNQCDEDPTAPSASLRHVAPSLLDQQ